MGGPAAQTPATPGYLRVSDAERDSAVHALRQEFAAGRLSHETFMFRMSSALGARNRAQLAGLFTDLPPRRPPWLARLRAALGPRGAGADARAGTWPPDQLAPPRPAPWPDPPGAQTPGTGTPRGPVQPAPMVFPPGPGATFTIGRRNDCDLRIADMSVSRLHARLDRGDDGWLLTDLGSHNGTRVNGWLVRDPVPVRAGDVLQFGTASFVIQGPPAPAAVTG
jgi:hypothetical protein